MTAALHQLIDHLGLRPNNGAVEHAIAALEKDLQYEIEPRFRAVLKATDGLNIDALDAEILSVEAIHEIWRTQQRGERWQQIIGPWKYEVPVVDTHNSDYFTVTCRPPLAPRIIHAPHDDGSRLMFRDIDGLFRWLVESARSGVSSYESNGDFDDACVRTPMRAICCASRRQLMEVIETSM